MPKRPRQFEGLPRGPNLPTSVCIDGEPRLAAETGAVGFGSGATWLVGVCSRAMGAGSSRLVEL